MFNALAEGLPGGLQLLGFAIALVGIWLLSRQERVGGRPSGLGMAILAGFGFGIFFIALDQIGASSVFWPLAWAWACWPWLSWAITMKTCQLRQ